MSITYAERIEDTSKAPDGVPQMLFNHFVSGPGQAIAARAAGESVTGALRRYLVEAWDGGCARLYGDSRDVVLVSCSMPSLPSGTIAARCEDLLAATLREELGSQWLSGPAVSLMAGQLFTAIRLVMEEMRRQIIAAASLEEASAAIRSVVATVFDQLESGLAGIGARTAAAGQ